MRDIVLLLSLLLFTYSQALQESSLLPVDSRGDTTTTTTTTTSTTSTLRKRRKLQSSNNRVIAEAYECDEYLQEVSEEVALAYKPLGYEIRICVAPAAPTRNRGIVMRSIDDFTWYKAFGSAVQPAIQDKSDVANTLSICLAGQEVCTFKTKLIHDLFYGSTNGTITGTGTASMQVEEEDDDDSIGNRRNLQWQSQANSTVNSATTAASTTTILQGIIQWRQPQQSRSLQADTAAGGFAGSSGISLNIYIDKLLPPSDYVPEDNDDDIGSWWQDSPTWLKALIVTAGALVIVMGVCLCLMCCWACSNEFTDQKTKQEQQPKNINTPPHPEQSLSEPPATTTSTTFYQVQPPIVLTDWNESEEMETEHNNEDDQEGTDNNNSTLTSRKPTKKDICFDSPDHPGTKAMYNAIQKTVKSYPTEEYAPDQYRHIKKQLKGRHFYVRTTTTDNNNEKETTWNEVPKAELVELLRREFESAQQQVKQQKQNQ